MPHLVTSRIRHYQLSTQNPNSPASRFWEKLNIFVYKVGGVMFVVGSVLFFPGLSAWQFIGDWLFIVGSLFYLLVTGHDLLETRLYWSKHHTCTNADAIEIVAAWNYVIGSLLFTVGSLFFLPQWGWIAAGSWCFIIGSAVFIIGGCANLLQVVAAPSFIYLQLFNFTLVMFIVGAALFLFATVPFLQHYDNAADQYRVHNLAAGTFVVGSILFLLGGIMIALRTFVQKKLSKEMRPSRFGLSFIAAIQREIAAERENIAASPQNPDNKTN